MEETISSQYKITVIQPKLKIIIVKCPTPNWAANMPAVTIQSQVHDSPKQVDTSQIKFI